MSQAKSRPGQAATSRPRVDYVREGANTAGAAGAMIGAVAAGAVAPAALPVAISAAVGFLAGKAMGFAMARHEEAADAAE